MGPSVPFPFPVAVEERRAAPQVEGRGGETTEEPEPLAAPAVEEVGQRP